MGNQQARNNMQKPKGTITIRYTLMPENMTGQIGISNKTTLDEVQMILSHLVPTLDKYRIKCESFNGKSWVVTKNQAEWRASCDKYIKSRTIEPFQFRVTKKAIPLHLRRLSPLPSVNVAVARRGPAARKVPAPIYIDKQSRATKDVEPFKVSNNELFSYVLEREAERKYLNSSRH
ncbi:nuclear export mediator factor Nemf [Acrasis kona]|uniref:Nuclear export mediator factor Nemf n=1 Tax=Acrasis kona TaxID=1008807 RepID=A0AAW2Z205_9EUKA